MPQTEEFGLLRARCFEAWDRFSAGQQCGFLGFLTPFDAENLLLALPKEARKQAVVYGGFPEAERVLLSFGIAEEDAFWAFPISILSFSYPEEAEITHRDVLGALMGEKIRRECVGDILVRPGQAVVFVLEKMTKPLLLMTAIGRYPVHAAILDSLPAGFEQKRQSGTFQAASLRLDCIVGGLLHLSRGQSEELIRKKAVAWNGKCIEETDKKLVLPCTLSIQHHGKYRLLDVGGETKKGRLILNYEQYL